MCGLTGILGGSRALGEREEIVRRMTATLVHRGPDGEGYACAGSGSLGFRRLAIIDTGAPCPPIANEDRTVWCVANAEIYNGDEIRAGLEARGHTLRTTVDTEVLPHLYEERGADLVEALNGMFALAVWDARRERLLLARDRAGEKPLFYWQGDGELVFASELRALLAHPGIAREIDPVALRRYLLHGFFPAPLTPIAGVRKLPAGHLLVARPGQQAEVRRYWDLAEHLSNGARGRGLARRSPRDLAAELDERIGLAVARRSRSDVPLGLFLSGGLDSSYLLAHLAEQQGAGVPVFALGHGDREFDESQLAGRTARHFGAEFHELVLGETDLADGLRRVAEGFDEPLADASIIPSHLLARYASQRVKVVLSGEGADELFAGYPTYLGHRLARGYRRLPKVLRRGLSGFLQRRPVTMGNVSPGYLLRRFVAAAELDLVERHHSWFGSLDPGRHGEILAPAVMERLHDDDPFGSARALLAGKDLPDPLAKLLYTDFSMYLQDDLLTKVDRATMLASIEARAPYLDHELVEFAAALPSHRKLSGFTTKAILRRAARRRLPREVLSRRKRGFNIPFSRWLLHGLGEQLRTRFDVDRTEARGLLSPGGVHRLLDEHLSRRADHRNPLFNLLVLDLWCDKVFGEASPIPVASSSVSTTLERVA